MYLPLDGPSLQGVLSVGTVTPVRVKIGANEYSERKAITFQSRDPSGGKFYIFFANDPIGSVPSAATIIASGFLMPKNAMRTFEAADSQIVYILSVSGTINVTVAERS